MPAPASVRRKARVLVVDDSVPVRCLLTEVINAQSDLEVVGTAPDSIVARELIKQLAPDVLMLDVEMPRLGGLDFLEQLMRWRPMPVLMVAPLTQSGSEAALRALELGAVDFVAKPMGGFGDVLAEHANEIAERLRTAAAARVRRLSPLPEPTDTAAVVLRAGSNRNAATEKLIIIGASTGGTEAIKEVLRRMPPDCPGILVAQHMPENFTRSFARRLDALCAVTVREARDGERILPGHAFIAPGHSHLLLKRSGANYVTELSQAPAVNRHRPSVDVLFRAAAKCAGRNAIGVILTGMGKDGAAGMREMKQAGAVTFAQDETSCVVFGMPKEAIALGGVGEVVSLDAMAAKVLGAVAARGPRAACV